MSKITWHYNDTVKVEFNPDARNRYLVTVGEESWSPVGVTTCLGVLNKPALMTWPMYEALKYLKEHPEDYDGASRAYITKSDKGKTTGTDIHSAIEAILNDLPYQKSPEIVKPLKSFEKWLKTQDIKILATEQVVYSKELDFCGTYDGLVELEGKVVLLDWKTTNTSRGAPLGIYEDMYSQLGAYSLAHHEENPLEKIEDLMVVRVGKDGVLNTLRASELGLSVKDCEDSFASILKTYRFRTPLTKQLAKMKP